MKVQAKPVSAVESVVPSTAISSTGRRPKASEARPGGVAGGVAGEATKALKLRKLQGNTGHWVKNGESKNGVHLLFGVSQ